MDDTFMKKDKSDFDDNDHINKDVPHFNNDVMTVTKSQSPEKRVMYFYRLQLLISF